MGNLRLGAGDGCVALGFITFPMRVVGWHFEYLPGDPVDDRLNNFVLEHGYRYVTGLEPSFWNAPAFYPATRVTGCSDAHLGMLPVYVALRLAGLSPEGAFQGWFLAAFVLNYLSSAWVLRRLGLGAAACACGGYLFTFGLPVAAQLVHAQLSPRFLIPPALLFAWEFLGAPRLSRLIAFLACLVGEVLIGVYSAYFLVLVLGMGGLVAVVLYRSRLPWHNLLQPGGRMDGPARITALAFLAILPLGIQHALSTGIMPVSTMREYAPHPSSWFSPPPIARASALLNDPDHLPDLEQRIFPGFVPLAAVATGLLAAFWTKRFGDRAGTVAVAAWSVALLVMLVTAFEDMWLYRSILAIPGGGTVRAIGRIVLVLLFPMAVIVASGVDWLVGRASRLGKIPAIAIGIAAVALVAWDQSLLNINGESAHEWGAARYTLQTAIAKQDAIKAVILRHPHPTVVYVFTPPDVSGPVFYIRQIEAMRASQDLGLPCVNGYSGYLPHGWKQFLNECEVMEWLVKTHAPPERLTGIVYVDNP